MSAFRSARSLSNWFTHQSYNTTTPILRRDDRQYWRADLGQQLLAAGSLGIRVQFQQSAQILQGVLLQGSATLLHLGRPHNALDLVRVDEPGEVAVSHGRPWQDVPLLQSAGLLHSACEMGTIYYQNWLYGMLCGRADAFRQSLFEITSMKSPL